MPFFLIFVNFLKFLSTIRTHVVFIHSFIHFLFLSFFHLSFFFIHYFLLPLFYYNSCLSPEFFSSQFYFIFFHPFHSFHTNTFFFSPFHTLSLSLSLHLTSFILTFLSFSPFTDTHTSSFFLRQHLPLHVHFLNTSQTDFLTTAGILQFSSQFCPCQVFPPFVHLSSTTS